MSKTEISSRQPSQISFPSNGMLWCCSLRLERRYLSLPRKVRCLTEDAGRFLWCVEAHRVLGCNEVESPLCPALKLERQGELFIGGAARARGDDGVDEVDDCLPTVLQHSVIGVLDTCHTGLDLLLGELVAGLAGATGIQ